ncbi:nucleotidyltransferase domain-containing protein [Actinoplanes sp. NPDC049265]|uniref:nucleotidyltransferase domain-containing protein n=1 Tax=Actinoplanes sp. NPDC049265 TaxID=3363902 RepID=UPI00371024E0
MHPDIDAWLPWDPPTFTARMPGADFPWMVAGGWAIDLFVGEQTREHGDLEIAVASSFFATVPPRFPELDFWVPRGEGKLARMTAETLGGDSHQTWAYDRAAQAWRFDVFREPHDGDIWICRRDESIRRPYSDVVSFTDNGIPYLNPEVVLLFKAKWARDKDQADLATAWPRMSPGQRDWFRQAVAQVHPGHEWASLE